MEQWQRTIWPELSAATDGELQAYLIGAAHDACFSRQHRTTRFAQKDRRWLTVLGLALDRLGYQSWTYQEGTRDVYVLETSWAQSGLVVRTAGEVTAYVRGYFDAEGGVPRSATARSYIQVVQKDRRDLEQLHLLCLGLGLECGRIHNPSAKVDPSYWRFYILKRSHQKFFELISSWHPTKRVLLEERFLTRRDIGG